MRSASAPDISPADFELLVKGILDKASESLVEYTSCHQARINGSDGEYVIDVLARFSALGAEFKVIVECKRTGRSVERQDVQVLHAKVSSLGAHKGMLFSTSGFQSGAVEYAEAHGIALVEVATGESNWHTRSAGPPTPPPPWVPISKYIGWLRAGNSMSLMSELHGEYARKFLGLSDGAT